MKTTNFFSSNRILLAGSALLLLFSNFNTSYAGLVATDYSFYNSNTGSYVSPIIGSATVLSTGVALDNAVYSGRSIGFDFTYKGVRYSTINVSTNGFITFGTAPSSTLYTPLSTNFSAAGVVAAFAGNLTCGTTGDLRIVTISSTTTPGTSICVIQWSHYRKASTDDLSFQIRLYQSNNAVEVRYGTMTTSTSNDSVQVGLRGTANTTDLNCRNVNSSSISWNSSSRTTRAYAPYGSGRIPFGESYLWTVGSADASTRLTITNDTTTVARVAPGGTDAMLIRSDLYFAKGGSSPVSLLYTVDRVLQPAIAMTADSTFGLYRRYHATLPAISAQHAEVVYYENFTNADGYEINAGHIAFEIGSLKVTLSSNSESVDFGGGAIALSHTQTTDSVELRAASSHSPIKITQVTLDMLAEGRTVTYPSYIVPSVNKDLVEIRNLSATPLDISGFTFIFEPPYYPAKPCRTLKIPKNQTLLYPGSSCIINIGQAANDPAHHYYSMGGTVNSLISSDPCGFILQNQNGDIIDAVAANGFTFDGSMGEEASDWFGIPVASSAGYAGLKRYRREDHNCAVDWMVADSSHRQTIGASGYMLDSAFEAPVIQWSTPFGSFTGETIIVPPLSNGSYNLTATADADSNTAAAPLNILVHAPVVPAANFYADITNPFVNQTVTFHDSSDGYPTNWHWYVIPDSLNYLNGTTINSKNPQVQFAAPGTYSVSLVAGNADGADSTSRPNYITVHPLCYAAPATPGSIVDSMGIYKACPGDISLYSIAAVAGAESYTWTVPTGAIILSGQGTYAIVVQYNSGFTSSGAITVRAVNNCGNSAARSLTITRNNPAAPGTITVSGGIAKVCQGEVRTYSVAAVSGMTYTWTSFTGANITGGQGSHSITVSFTSAFTAATGTLKVSATNGCGTSALSSLVISKNNPAQPGTISVSGGSAAVCPGDSRQYSVPADSNLTFNWTAPTGGNITSGQGSSVIHITFTSGFTSSGTLKVTASNACGTSAARTLTISRNLPATPGAISGTSPVCNGSTHTYSIASVPYATSYNWTKPTGSTFVGAQHGTSVSIHFGSSGGSITVKAVNSCGTSGARSRSISMNCREAEAEADQTAEGLHAIVFPNPTPGKITIKFSGNEEENYNIKVTDVTGRIIYTHEDKSHEGINLREIDLTGYPDGIYFIDLVTGNYIQQMKVAVQ